MPRKRMPKQTSITVPNGAVIEVGHLVSYYLNGWRLGYLEEIIGASKAVKIRPMKEGSRLVTLAPDDLRKIEETRGK